MLSRAGQVVRRRDASSGSTSRPSFCGGWCFRWPPCRQLFGGENQVQEPVAGGRFRRGQVGCQRSDPKAFQFEVPQGAEQVKMFLPPDMFQLLGKRIPDFKFTDRRASRSRRIAGRQGGRAEFLGHRLRAVPGALAGVGKDLPEVKSRHEAGDVRRQPGPEGGRGQGD